MADTMYWPLPDVIDPPNRRGICVSVPDDPAHLAAFMGALYGLSRWYNWDRDDAHTGKEVAAVWYDVITHLGECQPSSGVTDEMQFRQNGCKLEYSVDCVHWLTLYDPTDCIDKKLNGGERGTGALNLGECKEWDVTLKGSDRWLCPVPVADGFTIEITDMQGAWSDGTSAWNCPDGTPYVLGLCVGAKGHATGDPSGTAYHMAIVGLLDGTTFIDVGPGPTTLTPVTGTVQLELQANDQTIGDNFGTITFHVKICESAPTTFAHTFDFTIDDRGWDAYIYGGNALAVYTAATGWFDNYPAAPYDGIFILSPTPSRNYEITNVEVLTTADLNDNAIFAIENADQSTTYLNTTAGAGNPVNHDIPGTPTITGKLMVIIDNNPGGTSHSSAGIASVTISGNGPDPF